MRWTVASLLFGCAGTALPHEVDVRSFGATGDGQTDDTAALQAAIDSVADGGTITIPDGTYMVNAVGDDGGLQLHSNQTLELTDGAILEVIPNDAIEYGLVRIYGVHDVVVRGGTLIGDRAGHLGTDGEWGHGVNIRASQGVLVDHVTAREFWGDGFYIGRNLTEPPASHGIAITRCVADSNRRQGLSITDASDVMIWNNLFTNTHGTPPEAGIDLEPSLDNRIVQNIDIRDNQFSANTFGLLVVRYTGVVDHVSVLDNQMTTSSQIGIYLDGTPTAVAVERNAIDANAIGVEIQGTAGSILDSNAITHSAQQGLVLDGATSTQVIRNRIEGNGDPNETYDNVSVRGSSDANLFQANVVRVGQVLPRYGIQIATPDCERNSIIDNDLTDSGAVGAVSDFGTDTVIHGNSQ